MCSAIWRRTAEIRTTSSPRSEGIRVVAGLGARARCPAMYDITSSRRTRPSWPVPLICDMSRPFSSMSLRIPGLSFLFGVNTRALDLQLGEGRPYRDRLSGSDLDAHKPPLDGGGDLGIHLVGDDLDDGLVAAHQLALPLEPAVDRALGDRFAELRHLERGQ